MGSPDWETMSKKERRKATEKALRRGDVSTLTSLTMHNLLLFGRGGAHTSPHTVRSYRTGVRKYLEYALPKGWERLTEYDTDLTVGYIRHLQRSGIAPGTINSRRSAARALYRALRWAGVLHADPIADTPRAQDPEARWDKRQAYSREDVRRLLAVASTDERLFLLLGAHAGLRISELVGLEWTRVDLGQRTLRVTGKGGKTALVHMSAALHQALDAVPEAERVGYVLPWRNTKSVRLHLRALCHLAGVTYAKRQVHGLRHAAATMLLEDSGDLYVVARHLRHSSVSTTEAYAKVSASKITDALRAWGSDEKLPN